MERICPNGWSCKHFPMEGTTQRGYSQCDSVVPASVASPGPFHSWSVSWPWKTNNPVVQPSYFFSLFCLSVGFVQCWCFWDLSKEQNSWDSDLCSVKKGIKTPTTFNTGSGPVSHGSLANTQKCILLSGIPLAVNMCNCLLVLKWYVIMNFPIEMGMS